MRTPSLFFFAALLVATGELVLGILLAGTVLGPYFWACSGATALLAVVLRRLLAGPREGPGGGGGEEDPERPPPWWPDFEVALREYLREAERARV